jgi:ABC-2 type transport system permease protein
MINSLRVTRTLAITERVYRQLFKDRRFLALSLMAPLLIIFFLKITLDALTPPGAPSGANNSIVMPVVAAITFFLAYLLCALALVRERTRETLIRMFVSGYRRGEIVCGYLLGFAGLATVQALLALIEANLIFGLAYPFRQQVSLFLVIWLLAIISVALGIFFSNFARNEAQVVPFIPLVLLPSVFLSGILTHGVDALPKWAQVISYLIPLRYASDIIQGLIANQGLWEKSGTLLLLLLYGTLLLGVATMTLREYD